MSMKMTLCTFHHCVITYQCWQSLKCEPCTKYLAPHTIKVFSNSSTNARHYFITVYMKLLIWVVQLWDVLSQYCRGPTNKLDTMTQMSKAVESMTLPACLSVNNNTDSIKLTGHSNKQHRQAGILLSYSPYNHDSFTCL